MPEAFNITERYERGYKTDLTKEESLKFRQEYAIKSIYIGTILSASYLLTIYGMAVIPFLLSRLDMPMVAVIVAYMLALLVAVRQMRALENVVHFGSHYNLTSNKRINDLLVNVLAAWPMLSDVKAYRIFHSAHHGGYGSDRDPCRLRFERMGLNDLDLSTHAKLAKAVLRWLPGYVREYYYDVGSKGSQVATFVTWHAITLGAISLVSVDYAVTVLFIWSFAMFVILPVTRSIAEAAEHDYEMGASEFETTFNNVGFVDRWFLHPAGDAWHVLHHLHPSIPWWKQRSAHDFLMKHDPAYQQGLHRTSMVGEQKLDA